MVDDGSNDGSQFILYDLMSQYNQLRVFCLPRDSKRKLGFTRNFSIHKAVGEYVILHLDCDDIFNRHILDFVTVFHHIEQALGRDVLVVVVISMAEIFSYPVWTLPKYISR